MSQQLIDQFNGKVPETEQELLSIKGVGRKTANLVLAEAFNKPAICVDVHVHRLSNQLGLVNTKNPDETEFALQKIFPPNQWREINRLLVMLGQNSCSPRQTTVHSVYFLITKNCTPGLVLKYHNWALFLHLLRVSMVQLASIILSI